MPFDVFTFLDSSCFFLPLCLFFYFLLPQKYRALHLGADGSDEPSQSESGSCTSETRIQWIISTLLSLHQTRRIGNLLCVRGYFAGNTGRMMQDTDTKENEYNLPCITSNCPQDMDRNLAKLTGWPYYA